MRHLKSSTAKAALDIETFVGLTAVKDALVAADLPGDKVECLDDA